MIVKNECDTLPRALENIRDAVDEIVIVDTGSTDGTQAIADRYADRLLDFAWCDDFSAARNYALAHCTTDYFMWLDADDVVPKKTTAAIKRLFKSDALPEVIMLPYVAAVDEYGKPVFSYCRERIIKNRSGYLWQGRVHEAIAPRQSVIYLNAPIIHAKPIGKADGRRNLDIYNAMRSRGEAFSPRERYYYSRELFFNGYIREAARELEIFLDCATAFAANRADGAITLSRCREILGDVDGAVAAALNSLTYAPPCGESCCRLGELYLAECDYTTAAFWFECALRLKPRPDRGAFVQSDCYGYIPLMYLTVCHDRLGNTKKAFGYHRRAAILRPTDKNVLINADYFASLGYR